MSFYKQEYSLKKNRKKHLADRYVHIKCWKRQVPKDAKGLEGNGKERL